MPQQSSSNQNSHHKLQGMNVNSAQSFNTQSTMPGMQPLVGAQGLTSVLDCLKTGQVLTNNNSMPEQGATFDGVHNLGITAPTVGYHGIGPLGQIIPKVQPSKISSKAQGLVLSYAANTHNGTSRNYNEDRISIVLDLKKPGSKPDEPLAPGIKQASFFAVFDGHGGHGCAEFLRDNLHNIIANQASFPSNPEKALTQGFKEAEETFMKQNL